MSNLKKHKVWQTFFLARCGSPSLARSLFLARCGSPSTQSRIKQNASHLHLQKLLLNNYK